jgi:hypothetical protein
VIVKSRQENDRRTVALIAQLPQQLDSIHTGHANVTNYDIRSDCWQLRHKLRRIHSFDCDLESQVS